MEPGSSRHGIEPLDAVRARCTDTVAVDGYYDVLLRDGHEYGPAFRGVVELWRGISRRVAAVELRAVGKTRGRRYQIHPALLDASMQILGAAVTADLASARGAVSACQSRPRSRSRRRRVRRLEPRESSRPVDGDGLRPPTSASTPPMAGSSPKSPTSIIDGRGGRHQVAAPSDGVMAPRRRLALEGRIDELSPAECRRVAGPGDNRIWRARRGRGLRGIRPQCRPGSSGIWHSTRTTRRRIRTGGARRGGRRPARHRSLDGGRWPSRPGTPGDAVRRIAGACCI